MKRYNNVFQYVNNMVAVKWFDNRAMTMVGAYLGECNKVIEIEETVVFGIV